MGKWNIELSLIVLTIMLGVWVLPLGLNFASGQIYNASSEVNTTVNITNTAPQVLFVSGPSTTNLVAYGSTNVICNVSTYDYNNDTLSVNLSFHQSTTNATAAADQNFRYYNTSCTRMTIQDYSMNWSCTVSVNYFANNGTWYCNSTAIDGHNAVGSNASTLLNVNPLVALKMDSVLDYGQWEALAITNDSVANITNAGNRDINISVKGWGASQGDGYAMACTGFGTIPVNYEKFSMTNGTAYVAMTSLTSADTNISNFHVKQRQSETFDSVNSTFWKLQIPPNVAGICNGKILFIASDRGN